MNYRAFLIFEKILRIMNTFDSTPSRKKREMVTMWLLLSFIRENGTVTGTQVARRFVVKHPTATQLINRAEESGYITRTASQDDGRVQHLGITPKGEKFVLDLNERYDERTGKVVDHLSKDEHEQLVYLLGKMLSGLELERAKETAASS